MTELGGKHQGPAKMSVAREQTLLENYLPGCVCIFCAPIAYVPRHRRDVEVP